MSNYDRYTVIEKSTDLLIFEFTSCGPKGNIRKVVQFTPTNIKNVFNLAFGNYTNDGNLDDYTTNDNKDRDKILATVAAIVSDFIQNHPDCFVFFTGSTKERTRLYRIALSLNRKELSKSFEIRGLSEEGSFEEFQAQHNYLGFLISQKKT